MNTQHRQKEYSSSVLFTLPFSVIWKADQKLSAAFVTFSFHSWSWMGLVPLLSMGFLLFKRAGSRLAARPVRGSSVVR